MLPLLATMRIRFRFSNTDDSFRKSSMAKTQPIRRWTLRDLLTGAEKQSRGINEQFKKILWPAVRDLDECLSDPDCPAHRLENSVRQFEKASVESDGLLVDMDEMLKYIHGFAEREKTERF